MFNGATYFGKTGIQVICVTVWVVLDS